MPRIIARSADEWNVWGDPERFAHKNAVITAACEAIGRDPGTIARSTQATIFLGPDGAARAAQQNLTAPAIGGTVEQLIDIVGSYAEAGVDELIIPGGARSASEAQDLWSTFMEEILPNFRTA
jgi:alkanesulfonate monooxygenase SsuD/methylene tetrahydromethanopterin reductase-like flavin-dependent oxidoreductase (luciferase family)